jgi:hypothetical protein
VRTPADDGTHRPGSNFVGWVLRSQVNGAGNAENEKAADNEESRSHVPSCQDVNVRMLYAGGSERTSNSSEIATSVKSLHAAALEHLIDA